MKKIIKVQIAATSVAAACLFGAISLGGNAEGGPGMPPAATVPKSYPKVSTVQPVSGTFEARITGYGEVTPVQRLNLAAEVSGKVVSVADAFKSGTQLQAGAVLLTIDDQPYREAVASAESALAAAEVTLLQQQLNRTQAKAEWQRSGLSGSPDSQLALYEPQVKAAQAAVDHARRTLQKARSDLKKTVVRAPFNALVVNRTAELGSYVQTGTELAALYGTDQVELTVPLSSTDWQNLPTASTLPANWAVTLHDTESSQHWQGYVDRVAQHIDSNTRQRALIVRVDKPLDQQPPLYPGTFIEAEIPGKTLTNVWQVPASAITRNNEIWQVDDNHLLTKQRANVRLHMGDKVYLSDDGSLAATPIVTTPLSSYLPGMKVTLGNTSVSEMAVSSTESSRQVTP